MSAVPGISCQQQNRLGPILVHLYKEGQDLLVDIKYVYYPLREVVFLKNPRRMSFLRNIAVR
jgi:hypothetical protein